MGATYLAKKQQYTEYLQSWVDEAVRGKFWEKYVDLHIDEIDSQFKQPGHWIKASLFLLNCLLDIIDRSRYEVLLVCPLTWSKISTDLHVLRVEYFESEVGATPPSFYLFPINYQNFKETINFALYLPALSREISLEIYFKEERDGDEYFRVVYIKGSDT